MLIIDPFQIPLSLFVPLSISALAVLLTFIVAAFQDLRTRTVYRAVWYPAAIVGGLCAALFWVNLAVQSSLSFEMLLNLSISLILVVVFFAFSYLGMFGKADAKALILLSLTVPVTPFAEWIFPSLAVSTVVNAGVLTLAVPIFCLAYNIARKNRAPFWLMCSARPVRGSEVIKHFGFIAENIFEDKTGVQKSFVNLKDSLFSLRQSPRMNTRCLRDEPEKYEGMLLLCSKCETVWVTVGIPLLVPLTAGLALAMFGVSVVDLLLMIIM